MLRFNQGFSFPSLVRQDEVNFSSWSDKNKSKKTTIYKVDWDRVDKKKEDDWYKWMARKTDRLNSSSNSIYANDDDKSTVNVNVNSFRPFPGTIPEEYDNWVKNLVFAIPRNYIKEIRRCARLALVEWCTERNFDTMIRDICLMPAIAYTYVAFRLIADCAYDPKKNYFYRGDDQTIMPQAMLYKFWSYQTGRGLVQDHSYFKKITWLLKEKGAFHDENKIKIVKKFINAIQAFEKHLENSYTNREDDGDNEGPSLGEK